MMVDLKGYEVLSRNSAINGKALHQALPLIKVGWSWAISWDPSPCCQKCLDEAHHWGSKLELFQVQWISLCEPQSWATGSLVAPCEETCKVPICAQCGLQPDWQGVPGAQGNLEKGCAEEDWSWQVCEKDKKGSPLKKASLKKDSPSKKSQAGSSTDTLKKSSPHAKPWKKDQELGKRQPVMSLLIPMAPQKSWPPLRSHHQGCGRRRGWEQWASTRHQSLCTKVWRPPWAWIRIAWKSQQRPWKRQLGHQRLSRRIPWKRNLKKRSPQRRHPWKMIGSHGPRFQRQQPEILPDVTWQAATTKMRRCPTSGPSSTVLLWIGSKKHWRRTTSLRRRLSKWEWTCVHGFLEKGHTDMS